MFDNTYIENLKRSITFGWIIFLLTLTIGIYLGGYFVFLGFLILTIRYLALPIYIPHEFRLDPTGIFGYFHSLIYRHSFYGWTKWAINILIILSGFISLFMSGFIASSILLFYETYHLFQIKNINKQL